MKYRETNLQISVSILETWYDGETEFKFHVEYSPAALIYMRDTLAYGPFIHKYSFKHAMPSTIDKVVDCLKDIYVESLEYNTRIDVHFTQRDIAHLSTERRHESNDILILDKAYVSYNRTLSEEQRRYICDEMRGFFKNTIIPLITKN